MSAALAESLPVFFPHSFFFFFFLTSLRVFNSVCGSLVVQTQCLFSSVDSEVLEISDLMRTLTYPFTLRPWSIEIRHFGICFLQLDAEQRRLCTFCSVCIWLS